MIDFEDEGWFNATAAAQKWGKKPDTWVRRADTASYVCSLIRVISGETDYLTQLTRLPTWKAENAAIRAFRLRIIKSTGLVVTKSGGPEAGGGTWLHPKLAVAFARWLSSEFAIWCDTQISSDKWEDKLAEIIPEVASRAGYVYIISDGEKIKIGRSINPENRVRGISTQGGMKLVDTCFVSCENAHVVEAAAHRHFSEQRGIGEWFSVAFDEAVTVVKQLTQQEVVK
jgi:hypothetical protein